MWFLALGLFVPLLLNAGEDADGRIDYNGWKGCHQFLAPEKKIQAVLVPDIGARLIRYALDGENILFDNPDSRGKTLLTHPNGFWAGGYQIDVGPEMRGIPPHREMWMGPWEFYKRTGNALHGSLVTRSKADATLGLVLEKSVSIDAATGALSIGQAMTNIGTEERRYCLWDRTLCEGGGYALIRLNPKSRYKAGWCWGSRDEKSPGGWAYDGDTPSAPQVKILDGVLVAHCLGKHSKLGTDTHAGWIAYARGKVLFIKKFPVDPNGSYTDGGMTVATYFSDRVGELEPISPEVPLKPGESYSFNETWYLLPLAEAVDSHEKARALVPVIEAAVK